jgi:putative peptidoglycan lipid II flippase
VPTALASSGRVSAAVFASRILGLVREVFFAALFGAGGVADAFQVAFRIPNLLRDLFAEGALSSAFVPTFTAALHDDGPQRAHDLANLTLTVQLLATGAVTVTGLVFAEPITYWISDGFAGDADKVALAAQLTRILMPFLAIVALAAVWMGMLNARRHFVMPALAPALFNVVSIASGGVAWALGGSMEDGVLVWAVGTLVAGGAQAVVQLPTLWRMGYRPALRLAGALSDPGVRRIARLMGPAVIGVAAIQINIFVNTRFAGSLGDGAVSQLTYAFRLFFLPLGVFGVALATVATTSVSEEAARGDKSALAARAAESASAAWMLTGASAVGLWVLADPVCTVVYRHGQTTASDVAGIAWALRAYVCGLVSYSLVKILAPAYYSVDKSRIPIIGSVSAVAVNILFNALTYRQLGVPGIALGTALGATTNVLVLRLSLSRAIAPPPTEGRSRKLLALLAANAAMAVVIWAAWWAADLGLTAWLGPELGAGRVWMTSIPLAAVIALGFFAYVTVLRRVGYPGADQLARLPAGIWRRLRRRR